MGDALLADERKQNLPRVVSGVIEPMALPSVVKLQHMLETELSRPVAHRQGRLRHEQADQVVGQQVNPDFLDRHVRCAAAERFHAQGGFDVAQVQLDVPALAIEQLQRLLGRLFGAQHGRDQGLSTGTQLAHDHRRGRTVVLRLGPFGFELGFGQGQQMIARTQDQASTADLEQPSPGAVWQATLSMCPSRIPTAVRPDNH